MWQLPCFLICDGAELGNIPKALSKAPKDASFVIVQFATQEDYIKQEYRLMRIQKKYVRRFVKNMKEDV